MALKAIYENEEIVFAVLCDGMGGLAKGEVASASVIDAFLKWLDDNKVLVESSGVGESVKFALLFEFDGDVNAIRHVLYNCSASRPSIESETKEDTIEPGTETLSITADPRSDGLVKARTGDTTETDAYNNWYTSVYTPKHSEAA